MREEKRNVVAFLNMKGGVCKTTLCKEIALYIAEMEKKKVLVIDIDPQANCTQSFFERYKILSEEDDQIITEKLNLPSIQNIFSKSKDRLRPLSKDDFICELSSNLHLIPGDLNTVFMERETASGTAEQKLFNIVDEFDLKNEYEYIFIDCPPTYSFYTVAALLVSNYYFVPVVPDIYSILGLDLLERVVADLKNSYRANFKDRTLNNLGVILTKVPKKPNKSMENNIDSIKKNFKNIYFFENVFIKADKLSNSNLDTFIIDRKDDDLIKRLSDVCIEFERRVGNNSGE